MTSFTIAFAYIIIANTGSVFLLSTDKREAYSLTWRIPEATLL